MKKRMDQLLVDLGLAPSRTKAQELIESGVVEIVEVKNPQQIILAGKSSEKWDPDEIKINLADKNLLKYVSRAGLKLEGALNEFQIDVKDRNFLDVGQSTGGFTDCLLQHGANEIVGVDVATDELHKSLRTNKKVKYLTGVNARHLDQCPDLNGLQFDGAVIDVSFISITKIISQVVKFLKKDAILIALVKPQFELDANSLNKLGVVSDVELRAKAVENVKESLSQNGFKIKNVSASKLKGRDGNQEYLIYATKI